MHDQASLDGQWLLLRTLVCRRLGMSVRTWPVKRALPRRRSAVTSELFQKLSFPLLEINGERGRKTTGWRMGTTCPR